MKFLPYLSGMLSACIFIFYGDLSLMIVFSTAFLATIIYYFSQRIVDVISDKIEDR